VYCSYLEKTRIYDVRLNDLGFEFGKPRKELLPVKYFSVFFLESWKMPQNQEA
jgi:hypothetical protein